MRFESDEPSFKKTAYLLDVLAKNTDNARWYIGIDEDTINDIDTWIWRLDDEFNWEKDVYATPANVKNVQAMEFDLACLMGKQHWYTPEGGPFHEWEVACISQAAMKTILANPDSLKAIRLRQKIRKGWGDHFMGIVGRLAKIHAAHCLYLSPTHHIFEHSIMGGWIVHAHHIYKIQGMSHILPLFKTRNNGIFGGRKIFLSEIVNNIVEDKGFYNLDKNGVITGPPNWKGLGLWSVVDDNFLQLSFCDKKHPLLFDLKESSPISKAYPEQNTYQILTG